MSQIRAVELAEEAGFRRGIETAAVVVDRARGEGFVDFRTLRDRIRALASPASSPAAPAPVAAPRPLNAPGMCPGCGGRPHIADADCAGRAPREAAPEACPALGCCRGTYYADDGTPHTCPDCNGTGRAPAAKKEG